MKKKNGKFSTVLLLFAMFIGLALLLYPTVSDLWNAKVSSHAVQEYVEQLSHIDDDKYKEIWQSAADYNANIRLRSNIFLLSEEEKQQYNSNLDVGGTGIMAYIEIPSINVMLPIYHGTEEPVLQVAVGHLEWTSLPSGGEGTHAVLSGHRGLPSAKLFTDLDKIIEGDIFILRVLDEILTYQVDKISIVEPHETDGLMIVDGMDYCTLVTCTPYGINSHRLLVRGHRIENIEESKLILVTSDAVMIDPMLVAAIVLIPVLFIFMVILLIGDNKRSKQYGGKFYDN